MSFEQPSTTAQITGIGALHLLEAIRRSFCFSTTSRFKMFFKVDFLDDILFISNEIEFKISCLNSSIILIYQILHQTHAYT